MQFLCKNAIEQGRPGTFVSFVENGAKLRRNFARFNWDVRSLEKKGLVSILDLIQSPKRKGIEANFNFIMDQIELTESKGLVIDSLNAMMVSLLGNKAEARSFAGLTKKFLETTGCTALLIQELPWARTDFGLGFEEFLVDGVIALDTTIGSTRVRRQLFIPKMRGTNHSLDLFDYNIASEGITIAQLPLSNM